MNILFFSDAAFVDSPGGSRTAAHETAKLLVQRGHQVVLMVSQIKPGTPEIENTDGFVTVRVPKSRLGPLTVSKSCSDVVNKFGPFDIVHTHFAYQALGPLALGSSIRHVPHVRTFHGPWCEEGWTEDIATASGLLARVKAGAKRTVRHAIEQDNLGRSDIVTVLSEFMRTQLTDHFNVPPHRIKKIVGGSNIERFVPPADRERVRSRLGWERNSTVLVTVRRLAARMGLDRLLRAFQGVAARRPDTRLVIGGQGPERPRLEEMIRELGLVGRVEFAGFISDQDLPDFLGAADLFILPTIALEGFGLVIVESLATGTPVLGTPVGAIGEILEPLDPRFLCRDASHEAIEDGIMDFLEGGWSEQFGRERLRNYVLEHYTWERSVDELENLYSRLISSAT